MDERFLTSAMARLAGTHGSFADEAAFRDELFAEIAEGFPGDGTRPENPIAVDRMPNEHGVFVDITLEKELGLFAIELKYVPKSGNGVPQDQYGQLPYDSHKDRAKIETLIDAGKVKDGIVVCLTDYKDYWVERDRTNWARNFYLPDKGKWAEASNRLEVQPARASWAHATEFGGPGRPRTPRPAIMLRCGWEYRWFDYGNSFRYLIIRRSEKGVSLQRQEALSAWYEVPGNWARIIPYESKAVRDRANAYKTAYQSAYRGLNPKRPNPGQGICPICQGELPLPQ